MRRRHDLIERGRPIGAAAFLLFMLCGAGSAGTAPPPDSDPYLWLSNIRAAKSLAWVKGQNAKSETLLKTTEPGYALYRYDHTEILNALNAEDRIPLGPIDHGVIYNFWQDASHERGIWRRMPIADYDRPCDVRPIAVSPGCHLAEWELLLDVDKLDADEHAKFVWQGADCVPGGED